MLSIVFTFYRTLDLKHLERALCSLSMQTALDQATELVFVDNNTNYAPVEIENVVREYEELLPEVKYHFMKHGQSDRCHSWSANYGIRAAENDLVFFTRADYILMEDCLERMLAGMRDEQMAFMSGWCYQMACQRGGEPYEMEPPYEAFGWRDNVRNLLLWPHAHLFHETDKDAGTYLTTRTAVAAGGWYDELMVSFGYQQSTLQRQMSNAGVRMEAIQEFLFCHQHHEADRDFARARHEYMRSRGG